MSSLIDALNGPPYGDGAMFIASMWGLLWGITLGAIYLGKR